MGEPFGNCVSRIVQLRAAVDRLAAIRAAVDPVEARAAGHRVEAVVGEQEVVARVAEQEVGVGVADDHVVPAAADPGIDERVAGNGDVVDHAVGAAERSRVEIDPRGRGPAGQVERVVKAEVPDRDDRVLVDGEIEVPLDRIGNAVVAEVDVEPERVTMAVDERTRGRDAVEALCRQDVQHHRGGGIAFPVPIVGLAGDCSPGR